jgi:hypothetical protein
MMTGESSTITTRIEGETTPAFVEALPGAITRGTSVTSFRASDASRAALQGYVAAIPRSVRRFQRIANIVSKLATSRISRTIPLE